MSRMWFALTCLAVFAVADAHVADSIRSHIASNIKPLIDLENVSVFFDKGDLNKAAKVSSGKVKYTGLGVTIVRQTDKQIVFTVSGEVACNYEKYEAFKKTMPAWSSSSSRNQNRFQVTLDVSNCKVSNAGVASEVMEGVGTCQACEDKTPKEMDQEMMSRFSSQIIYEVKVKINQAIKAAVSTLNLKGSGFKGC